MSSQPKIILGDCLEVMRGFADNQFDLILTDPPYGIARDRIMYKQAGTQYGKSLYPKGSYDLTDWDHSIPTKAYFDEIRRVSKNQIIFGGNYFVESLANSSCWLVWDKDNLGTGFADCELAWTSFTSAVRYFKHRWNGMLQHDMKNKDVRVHPMQKPLRLMKWCLANYSKEGDSILDPFMGSGTTLRAAKDLGRESTGIELNPKYIKMAEDRLRQELLF